MMTTNGTNPRQVSFDELCRELPEALVLAAAPILQRHGLELQRDRLYLPLFNSAVTALASQLVNASEPSEPAEPVE